jgi:hypothetical protein
MHLVKLQVLQCITCEFEHASNDVLVQGSTLCKGLIKYNKTNGSTPMITHVQTIGPRLFTQRKQQSNDNLVEPNIHVQ